jgi:hypothetical protein
VTDVRNRPDGHFRPVPFRVRLGVTGHRSLPDDPALRERVREALSNRVLDLVDDETRNELARARYTSLALTVVTPLAEGADRLVAEQAFTLQDSAIEVVLPFAKAEYLEDFATAESRQEFEELLDRARKRRTLRTRLGKHGATPEELAAARREAYAEVGRHVVDACDIVVALWDGQPSRGQGSTAEIVAYAQQLDRPTIVIATRPPYSIRTLGRPLSAAESVRSLEEFNAFELPAPDERAYTDNFSDDLFGSGSESVALATQEAIRRDLIPMYVRASTIAKRHQRRHELAARAVYICSLLALSAVAIGTLVPELAIPAFILEFLLLLAILATVVLSDHAHVHRKWVENRFLAERVRSAIFFAACGLDVSPLRVPAHVGSKDFSEAWMVSAFDEAWARMTPAHSTHEAAEALADFVRQHWIRDQISYHEWKSSVAEKRSKRLERGGAIVFSVALLAPAAHLLLASGVLRVETPGIEEVLTFAALLLPALGAALEGIRSHGEYSRIAKRSANMAAALRDLDRLGGAVKTRTDLRALMVEVEQLLLAEAADWLTLMRFAKVEAVA